MKPDTSYQNRYCTHHTSQTLVGYAKTDSHKLELNRAYQSRNRQKQGVGDSFYYEQEQIRRGWLDGEPTPQGLIIDNYSYAVLLQPSLARLESEDSL